MLALFRDGRYRLLWINGALSDMGLIMFFMVHGWLALTLTDSPFWVGATAGVQGLGILGASTVVGVLVDRLDRGKLLAAGQLLQAAMLLGMAVLISIMLLFMVCVYFLLLGLLAELVIKAFDPHRPGRGVAPLQGGGR